MYGKRLNMNIGWEPDMIGWACGQPFPTLAMPLCIVFACKVDAIKL